MGPAKEKLIVYDITMTCTAMDGCKKITDPERSRRRARRAPASGTWSHSSGAGGAVKGKSPG